MTLSGYVHKDLVTQRVEFKQAVSVEEEKQKAEEAARIKKEADDAIAKVEELKKESGQSTENKDTPSTSIGMIAQNPNADNGTTKEPDEPEQPGQHKPEYRKHSGAGQQQFEWQQYFYRQQHGNFRQLSEHPERTGKCGI